MQPTRRTDAWPSWLLPAFALAVGVLGIAAAWVGLSLLLRSPVAWMAPLAALDMAWMLRLAAAPAGRARAALAMLATAVATAVSLWLVAAATIGRPLGLHPLESASRMGPVLAGELLRHATDGWDIALLLVALPLAWRLGR